MPSSHLILCHPLLLLPSIFPSIRVFSNESALRIRWPKYWSFSFSISPSNEHSGQISFRMDWLDLPVVQQTVKILLQNHNSEASALSLLYGPAPTILTLIFLSLFSAGNLVSTSLVAWMVKHLPTMRETQVQSLGREDPLEKGMAPTPVFWPGKFHGQRSLAGYSHGVAKSLT